MPTRIEDEFDPTGLATETYVNDAISGISGGASFNTVSVNSENVTVDYGDVAFISTLDAPVTIQLPIGLEDKAPIMLVCVQATNTITVNAGVDFGGTVDVPELQELNGYVILETDASVGWYKVSSSASGAATPVLVEPFNSTHHYKAGQFVTYGYLFMALQDSTGVAPTTGPSDDAYWFAVAPLPSVGTAGYLVKVSSDNSQFEFLDPATLSDHATYLLGGAYGPGTSHTADYGETIFVDSSAATISITLPIAAADQAPITIIAAVVSNPINIETAGSVVLNIPELAYANTSIQLVSTGASDIGWYLSALVNGNGRSVIATGGGGGGGGGG